MGRKAGKKSSPYHQFQAQQSKSGALAQVTPARAIGRAHIRTLNTADGTLLDELLSVTMDYMDSPSFREQDAEIVLFEKMSSVPEPDVSWYHPVMSELGFQSDCKRKRTEVMRLTGPQEQTLFWRFNYARYRTRLIQNDLGMQTGNAATIQPTAQQTTELLDWARKAQQLRDQIAETNVGLVLAMVRRSNFNSVDITDLVSEGNMALLRAIDKFNADLGNKFSTYACQSIIKGFSRLGMKESTLKERFPVEFDPDLEEDNWSSEQHQSFEDACASQVADIVETNQCGLTDVELEVVKHRFGFGKHHANSVAMDAQPRPTTRRTKIAISDALRVNTEATQRAIEAVKIPQSRRRSKKHHMTLGEVGQMIGVGKERVRQIQVRALEKIKQELEDSFIDGVPAISDEEAEAQTYNN